MIFVSKQVLVCVMVVFLIACASSQGKKSQVIFDEKTVFSVELALTSAARETGLMNRESLEQGSGMLFVFEDEVPRGFWMKNTLIPLDIIFLDKEMSVVEIKSDVPPCITDPCQTYVSLPAQYVLEINSGGARTRGIVPGSSMRLRQ